jgi:hypothetical protein
MTWYRKAADQGNPNAEVNVGWLYQNGWGVKQDDDEWQTKTIIEQASVPSQSGRRFGGCRLTGFTHQIYNIASP